MAGKRRTRARLRPMRWISTGTAASAVKAANSGARKCTALPPHPAAQGPAQQRQEHVLGRPRRRHQVVLDAALAEAPAHVLEEAAELLLVGAAHVRRVREQPP